MARVLNNTPVTEATIVCHNGCKLLLAYVPNDVLRRDGTDYAGGPDGEEYIICPNCAKKVVIRSW